MIMPVARPEIALAFVLLTGPLAAQTADYTVTGSVIVTAPENAASSMTLMFSGEMTAESDGTVTGMANLFYLDMEPCGWTPPEVGNGPAPHCGIVGVNDGQIRLSGAVTEWIERGDTHPYHDALFATFDARHGRTQRPIPAEIALSLIPEVLPGEHLMLWGFSGGGVEQRTTGAAALGLAASGLFDAPLTLVPTTGLVEGQDVSLIQTEGTYEGGTDISAQGILSLSDFELERFPDSTHPSVYLTGWTPPEMQEAEIDPFLTLSQPNTRADIPLEDLTSAALRGTLDAEDVPAADYGATQAQLEAWQEHGDGISFDPVPAN